MIHFKKENIQNRSAKPDTAISLKMKMILLIGFLIFAIVIVIGIFLDYFVTDTLEMQMGERAMSVAESVALNPLIVEAFSEEDPAASIQPVVEPVRQATGAEFIVVGNQDEIRYSHPNPEQIGQQMVGEDNERALLKGESYISRATGSLGSSLRAKVPVVEEGEIIGVVSVGFLADDVQTIIGNYNQELWLVLGLIGAAALLGAIWISSYIKRILYGLEPEEISRLLFQKETILQSTHEGIVAIDSKNAITMVNAAALHLLFDSSVSANDLIGQPIHQVLPASELPSVLASGQSRNDTEHIFGNHIVYINSVPIYADGSMIGAVSTFRNKTEIELLTKELSRIKQYANALRAQTHEFTNKLYAISGMVQLNKKEEVLDFIRMENDVQQKWISLLIDKVSDPLVSGMLLGKMNQASELQIDLSIDPDSTLTSRLSEKKSKALQTAIGNLIDNAIDAVQDRPKEHRQIAVYFTDIADDILFEIDDSGHGIAEEDVQHIFEAGFSSKPGSDRGYGLALTNRLVHDAGGELHLETSELGGASFVISLPKEERTT
ncbi:ATP-binding protein [Planococcus salinus]|uniref:histidine kinase n=1 Tax=Planococcus salinus TaxID=1848460 RepID=A0A3M8P682_9BACL|nr:sensor histidine kinase [Planococcus salinus]RNF38911.1 sensor histidine kinase [Planococcus salinus]